MPLVIVGTGRSGTNLLLEVMTGNSFYDMPLGTTVIGDEVLWFSNSVVEDKLFFTRSGGKYPKRYLVKCDTHYCRSYIFFKQTMLDSPDLKVLFSIRHPYDICLSKIKRGHNDDSDDASFEGCISDIYHMLALYKRALADFPDRILTIRMEDIILNTEREARKICDWLEIPYEERMTTPQLRMRLREKRERYRVQGKNILDKAQVSIWKQGINNIYNGFFVKESRVDIVALLPFIDPIVEYFNYELGKF